MSPTGVILGRGSFGEVVEVYYKGKTYAAKKLHRRDASDNFSREIEIMSRIKHYNIVRYYGLCKLAPAQEIVIVMEKVENTLSAFLDSEKDIRLQLKLQILLDIIRGVRYLHNQTPAIIHRDLTVDNILLDREKTAKICDFGNSRAVNLKHPTKLLTSNPGAIDYMAPEALDGAKYDEKVDIFAFGHLSTHVIIQQRPYPLLHHTYRIAGCLIARSEVERRLKYLQEMRHELERERKARLYHIITQCLQDLSDERPSCKEIMTGLAKDDQAEMSE